MSDTRIGGSGPPVPPDDGVERRTHAGVYPIIRARAEGGGGNCTSLLVRRLRTSSVKCGFVACEGAVHTAERAHLHMEIATEGAFAPHLLEFVSSVRIDGVFHKRSRDVHDVYAAHKKAGKYTAHLTVCVESGRSVSSLPEKVELLFDPQFADCDGRKVGDAGCAHCLLAEMNECISEVLWHKDRMLVACFKSRRKVPDAVFARVNIVQVNGVRISVAFTEQIDLPKQGVHWVSFQSESRPGEVTLFEPKKGAKIRLEIP